MKGFSPYKLHVDRLGDDPSLGRPGQKGLHRFAASGAVVDGPLINVHTHEAVGELGVEVSGVSKRVFRASSR